MKINICMGIAALVCIGMLAGCAVREETYQTETSNETSGRSVIEGIAAPDDSEKAQSPLPPVDSIEVLGDCFVAPDPKTDPELVEFFGSYNCEPGYVYFEEETFGRVALLLDKKCKSVNPHCWYQNEEYFWTVSQENEIIKVNKRQGTYETLFTLDAPYDGDIYRLECSIIPDKDDPSRPKEEGRLIYFAYTDGYHRYILILERDTDKYDILHCTDGLLSFYGAGYQESAVGASDEPYICEVCGYTGNYVIWENNYHEFFWYHPETGENTPLVMSKNVGHATVFVLPEQQD